MKKRGRFYKQNLYYITRIFMHVVDAKVTLFAKLSCTKVAQ